MPEAEQRAAPLEREGRCGGQGGLERCGRVGQAALCGRKESAAAGSAGRSTGASHTRGIRLVVLEVGARQLELAEGDQRLDRVCPDGLRRVEVSAREQPSWQLPQIPGRSLQVAERELQPAEHAEAENREDLL